MAAVKTLDSVDALNRILDIATALWKSQTFFTACRLRVFEALGEAPATPEDLARRLSVNPLACRRWLVPLRELGLLEQEADQFPNSELGGFCTSTSSVPLEAASLWGVGTPFYHIWEFLPDTVRELSPRWQQVLGAVPDKAFGALYADPKRLRRFYRMARRLRNSARGRCLRTSSISRRTVAYLMSLVDPVASPFRSGSDIHTYREL